MCNYNANSARFTRYIVLCILQLDWQHFHPLLDLQVNRYILARHLGVDTFSCFVVATLGWKARHSAKDLVDAAFRKPGAMPAAGAEGRMFTYQPAAFRIGLFFFGYQVKNLYDTIVWNDGPEFIFHHILSMSVAWGSLHPGMGHFYASFFLGVSDDSMDWVKVCQDT